MDVLLYFSLSIMFITPFATPLSFNFTSFDPNGGDVLVYAGASKSASGDIQLTGTVNNIIGRAVYKEPMPLWDNKTGQVTDFTTHFSFVINAFNLTPHGDGMAFFLAHTALPVPQPGFGRGLGIVGANQTSNSTDQHPFVAVEFDMFSNKNIDPDGEHVGIDINSMNSSAYVKWCSGVLEGKENDAWISYNSASKNLSVAVTGYCDNITKIQQYVHFQVDLKSVLPEMVTIGFSGATGSYYEMHTLKSWSLDSSLTVDAPAKRSDPQGQNGGLMVTIGVGVGAGLAVLACGLGLICCRLRKKRNKRRRRSDDAAPFDMSMDDEFEMGMGPKRFLYDELARATSNFSEDEKLGQGGFGGVYRGFLRELKLEVAVKRVSEGSKQGKKEYASEVRIISRLRHKNLVQLIGWCHERRGLLLVYEFMPNGSLDFHLFKEKSMLTWEQRTRIAQGLASALLYLHEEWEQCVVHRDIKSSNIMLDGGFNAKLGDFGLARLVDHAKGSQTTVLAGTFGYMAPECATTGKASKESDVYSFGVVALEIACGRKPLETRVEGSGRVLVEWVWEMYGIGMLTEAADPRLFGEFDEQEMEQLMIVGLWCAHPDCNIRPSIRQAIQVLNGEASRPVLPPKMPVPTYTVEFGELSNVYSSSNSLPLSSISAR